MKVYAVSDEALHRLCDYLDTIASISVTFAAASSSEDDRERFKVIAEELGGFVRNLRKHIDAGSNEGVNKLFYQVADLIEAKLAEVLE